jgi:ketol-acid reductoisomerase
MKAVLEELRHDSFARALSAEAAADYPTLRRQRRQAAESALEAARRSLL